MKYSVLRKDRKDRRARGCRWEYRYAVLRGEMNKVWTEPVVLDSRERGWWVDQGEAGRP